MGGSASLKYIFSWRVSWPLFLALCACSSPSQAPLTIATAASMQYAVDSLAKVFTQQSGFACEVVVGSSGRLHAQITSGAPYDIFVAADTNYTFELFQAGLCDTPWVYGYGKLLLWSQRKITDWTAWALKPQGRIALANPQLAPYGRAAQEVLDRLNLSTSTQLVLGESIAQVNHFISLQAVEYGFTAQSAQSAFASEFGYWHQVPDSLYSSLPQAMALIKRNATLSPAVMAFWKFLQAKKAKEILTRFGIKQLKVNLLSQIQK